MLSIRGLIVLALGLCIAACGDAEPPLASNAAAMSEAEESLPEQALGQEAPSESQLAQCRLWPNTYRGPCMFEPRGKGSFSVTREDGSAFYDDVAEIIVFVFDEGLADVRAKHLSGDNDRWGEAKRSETYPACWIGDEFSVCAY